MSRMPVAIDAICPLCGAKAGTMCYGNGPMDPRHHPSRLHRALTQEIERLRALTAATSSLSPDSTSTSNA